MHFSRAATRLRCSTHQLQLTAPGLRVLLAQSLCVSHLLFGCVVWSPTLPVQLSLRPPRGSPIAHPMQVAYNGLLRWALHLPLETRVELLHILANLPPPTTLIAKQLVRYATTLRPPPTPQLGTAPPPPTPGRPRHATAVWDAILAAETPLDHPLHVAPIYWQEFVSARGAPPTVRDLYSETRALLRDGLTESAISGTLARSGTLPLWLDILPHLFAAGDTELALPASWARTVCPSLRGTQLRVADRPVRGRGTVPRLIRHRTPNWLTANSVSHLHTMLSTLYPPTRRLRSGGCPWC